MDEFFEIKNCQRCGKALTIRTLSKMNTDVICPKCCSDEKKHPRYKEASDMEHQQVVLGNYDYKGLFYGEVYPFNK